MQSFSEESKTFLKEYLLKRRLSKREIEVVMFVIQGLISAELRPELCRYREVAHQLCIAEKTVKFHLTNVYKRLEISRRSQIFWALPLVDFIGLNKQNPSINSNQEIKTVEEKSEELIPAGSSTVGDQTG